MIIDQKISEENMKQFLYDALSNEVGFESAAEIIHLSLIEIINLAAQGQGACKNSYENSAFDIKHKNFKNFGRKKKQ